jgi:hypothetical protein
MSFASLTGPTIGDVIDRFAGAGAVTLIVGAGASMEALLPSWPALIRRLLHRVADEQPRLVDAEARSTWVECTLGAEDLLAAGAMVEVMARDEMGTLLVEELFGPSGPASYEPGPTGHQVAHLRSAFGERLTILTTNYDDLIERALTASGMARRDVRSYVRRRIPPPGAVAVTHLHGYAARDQPPKQIVLTEEQYHRMQRGSSWQEQYVTERLENSLCLFVGTSLTDPNLIRYLYGYKQSAARPHAAIFVRQGQLDDLTDDVRAVREAAVSLRWRRCGVEAIFVDHYGDAAQLLYEIGFRRTAGESYAPVMERAAASLRRIGDTVLLLNRTDADFAARQVALSGWLRDTLYETLRSAVGGDPPADERLALALWLASEDGRTLTGWAHSDRAHQDPATIAAIPIRASSPWVAARTVCQGVRVERETVFEVSRWRFVRGLPLVLDRPSRLPIGCLTVSSTKGREGTVLARMPATAKAAFHDALVAAIQPQLALVAAGQAE